MNKLICFIIAFVLFPGVTMATDSDICKKIYYGGAQNNIDYSSFFVRCLTDADNGDINALIIFAAAHINGCENLPNGGLCRLIKNQPDLARRLFFKAIKIANPGNDNKNDSWKKLAMIQYKYASIRWLDFRADYTNTAACDDAAKYGKLSTINGNDCAYEFMATVARMGNCMDRLDVYEFSKARKLNVICGQP